MTESDREHLLKRKQQLRGIIKRNESLPKNERDAVAVADAKKRMATIDRWIRDKAPQVPVTPAPHKQEPKPTTPRKAEGIVQIDTIDELENSFHDIKRKNIMIKAPQEVMDYYIRMMKEFVTEELKHHYQADVGGFVHFRGVDPNGDKWNCWYKCKSRRRSKVEAEVLERVGYRSFEKWKGHLIEIITDKSYFRNTKKTEDDQKTS